MTFQEVFKKLHENPQPVLDEAIRIFSKIADNILKEPTNLKIRTLQKNNSVVSNKILAIRGGAECLKLMGFQDNSTHFIMPMAAPQNILQEFKTKLKAWKNSNFSIYNIPSHPATIPNTPSSSTNEGQRTVGNEEHIERVLLPPLNQTYTNPFLRRIEMYSHTVLQYENKKLKERARNLVPLAELEIGAQKLFRSIQEHVKKSKLADPDLSVQDMLILELLRWFKEDFFEWVDSPACCRCGGETAFSHMSTDKNMLVYTDRVELHRCKTCGQFTPFPRYNDLNILLETRRGRCGEWANTFTLFCRAMDWDSRFVVCEEDHVWTEVYSATQKRWLHCDPCENACDTPLMYEHGWHKQMSYVIAYSAEEVQDVTWRYSSRHGEVSKRRKLCAEEELLQALFKIRCALQKGSSEQRQKYLTKRSLEELVEFLTERKPNEDEQKGRSSGSAVWKLVRGEIQETEDAPPHVWSVSSNEIVNNAITIRYSASVNKYEYISGGKKLNEIENWNRGTFAADGIFRKEEKDWRMVYLARKEGAESGKICWKIDLKNCDRALDVITLIFDYALYENGLVNVEVCSETSCIRLPSGTKKSTLTDFVGSKEISVTATLSGGKGDVSWQHSQLFRQSIDSVEFPFSITLVFK